MWRGCVERADGRVTMDHQDRQNHPARWYGWSAVAASWLAVFCLFGYRATFAVLKGPMGTALGWNAAQVTLGYSLMMVCYAVTAYFSGLMLDRWGARPVYAVAAILGSLGFILTARAESYTAYLFAFGLFGGVATGLLWVTSTVSVRQWYIGKTYATMWGLAFSGAPAAQFVLSRALSPRLSATQQALERAVIAAIGGNVVAPVQANRARLVTEALADPAVRASSGVASTLQALDAVWRNQMTWLGLLVLAALALAALVARRRPEHYGLRPFGSLGGAPPAEREWRAGDAFAQYAIWGAILTFLTSMMAEFLIWTQVVSYWTEDVGFSLQKATDVYAVIGLVGVASMPLIGRLADWVVYAAGEEARGRKVMLLVGPSTGVVACIFLLLSDHLPFAYTACVIFAVYWAIVPGGVVGYTGAIYGRRALGRIWGLATLIVMGIGPFAGSLIGGLLRDLSGSYTLSIYYALGSFVVSALLAMSLPLTAR